MREQITRWGILGTGNIAGEFAIALRDCPGATFTAVGSRSLEKARKFAAPFGVHRCYGSYEELVDDDQVDVVYVATPHSLHKENSIIALQRGKSVLCEKPLAINEREGREIVSLAKRRHLFLMEAMWTRFLPSMEKLRQLIAGGSLGEIRMVSADLGFHADRSSAGRLFDPNLGGGSLLDVGIYPISLATMIFGVPIGICGQAWIGDSGVDEQASVSLSYERGQLANLYSSICTKTPQQAYIMGDVAMVHLYSNWWKGGPMRITRGRQSWEPDVSFAGNGYQFEAAEVGRCLEAGVGESPLLPLAESLSVLRLMDELRDQWDLRYPMELHETPRRWAQRWPLERRVGS